MNYLEILSIWASAKVLEVEKNERIMSLVPVSALSGTIIVSDDESFNAYKKEVVAANDRRLELAQISLDYDAKIADEYARLLVAMPEKVWFFVKNGENAAYIGASSGVLNEYSGETPVEGLPQL